MSGSLAIFENKDAPCQQTSLRRQLVLITYFQCTYLIFLVFLIFQFLNTLKNIGRTCSLILKYIS